MYWGLWHLNRETGKIQDGREKVLGASGGIPLLKQGPMESFGAAIDALVAEFHASEPEVFATSGDTALSHSTLYLGA
jgi:hypothetical protein